MVCEAIKLTNFLISLAFFVFLLHKHTRSLQRWGTHAFFHMRSSQLFPSENYLILVIPSHISFTHSGPSSDSTPLSYQIKFLIIVIELVKIPKLLSCFDIIAPNLMTFLLLFMVGFIYEDWGRTNMKKKLLNG